jgi:hypothetical protein
LGLEKKSSRWVPKLLSDDQKHQHVEIYTEFIDDVLCRSLARLNSFSTMDETGMQPHPSDEKNAQAGANKPNKS